MQENGGGAPHAAMQSLMFVLLGEDDPAIKRMHSFLKNDPVGRGRRPAPKTALLRDGLPAPFSI